MSQSNEFDALSIAVFTGKDFKDVPAMPCAWQAGGFKNNVNTPRVLEIDKVTFTGWLTQEELAHVYRRADAFCLASVVAKDGDRDGLPNVILEAMTYGIPVVASSLSAIP